MAQAVGTVVLEPAAREFARMTSQPPFLHQIPPSDGREKLTDLQSSGIAKPAVDSENLMVPGGPSGQVPVRIVRPPGSGGGSDNGNRLTDRVRGLAQDMMRSRGGQQGGMPVILYLHGGGWVFGDSFTHDRLIREIAVQADAAVVFPEYSRSPEAPFPTALEECYAVAEWISEQGAEFGLDPSRIAIAADSSGANLAAVITLLAKQRGGPQFRHQVLWYPVTNADFDTDSYREFDSGYYLRRDQMMWFWDQYLPDTARRGDPTASPLQASIDQLRGLPPALIITEEADPLRDEGEAYAAKLRQAGVPVAQVRYQGMIHDFVMLDTLATTSAARAATAQGAQTLRTALHTTH
ncbi:alpha/beta hydrolase [Micromonospora sp. NBC_01796]|uniref:alpha/beta hydrolase n=1 Tax=Micromonospora sp. NBC_01796 TaxID=2975987 RepID=UPI002DDBF2E3|nr:alpha/beta hydrolase [Micromonospora sp. NBC_01796]WSA88093.1 alpha/beta hydrolase [Micromonospora sp. NBC_01796]